MTGVEVRIEGAETTNKILRGLDFKIRRNIVQAATRAGMGVIRTDARRAAPSRTGLLRRQLTVSVKTDRVTGTVTGRLKPKRTKSARNKGVKHSGHYHHIVIGGAKPHEIKGGVIGGNYYSSISHPGLPPRPWMDRVVNSSYRMALNAFAAKLDERVAKEAMKARALQGITR